MEQGSRIQNLSQSLPKFSLAYTFSERPKFAGHWTTYYIDVIFTFEPIFGSSFLPKSPIWTLHIYYKTYVFFRTPALCRLLRQSAKSIRLPHMSDSQCPSASYEGKVSLPLDFGQMPRLQTLFYQKNVFRCIDNDKCFIPMSIEAGRERYRRGFIASGR